MSSGDYLDNFEDEEEFSDDDDDVRESKNFYNEGLGLGHVRRLEQENEVSRANSTDRELKLIGKYFFKIILWLFNVDFSYARCWKAWAFNLLFFLSVM